MILCGLMVWIIKIFTILHHPRDLHINHFYVTWTSRMKEYFPCKKERMIEAKPWIHSHMVCIKGQKHIFCSGHFCNLCNWILMKVLFSIIFFYEKPIAHSIQFIFHLNIHSSQSFYVMVYVLNFVSNFFPFAYLFV